MDKMDQSMINLSKRPAKDIKRYKSFAVNGYYFDTTQGHGNKSTYNSGVCVIGKAYSDDHQIDYYGVLEEIWELTYSGLNNKVVLFKCYWFDTQRGMQVHPKNGMVQIKHKSRAFKDDPFILAEMTEQVYYLPYVSKKRVHKDWWVAIRTKARSRVDWSHIENIVGDEDAIDVDDIMQEDIQPEPFPVSPTNELDEDFDDLESEEVDHDDDEVDDDGDDDEVDDDDDDKVDDDDESEEDHDT